MAVFRVEKTKNYTVMSNYHLRDKSLSLKAKGLLSLMLSLPDDWDYTTKGLAQICRDGVDSIRSTVRELEQHGYVIRRRVRNEKGQVGDIEYTILEKPETPASGPENPEPGKPDPEGLRSESPEQEDPAQDFSDPTWDDLEQEKPELENPAQDFFDPKQADPGPGNPERENPVQDFPAQLNTKGSSKEKLNTDPSNSLRFFQKDPEVKEAKRKITAQVMNAYRNLIRENIGYEYLLEEASEDRDRLDEIVELMTETVCSQKEQIRIGGNDLPAETVKSRFLKLDGEHIRFVLDCLERNTTQIRNIRQYLLTTLYNAPVTIDNYFTALVNHDLYSRSA